MMKNLLFAILFLSGITFKVYSQCIPDPTIIDPGIYPDTLPPACVNVPYSTTIQVRVLTDTVVGGLPVVITSIKILSVTGMPAGFSYACVPGTCIFPGGSNGCIQLTGNATSIGSFPLTVTVITNGTIFGIPAPPDTSTVTGYSIQVNSCVGVAENVAPLNFDLMQNNPNPFDKFTQVTFTTPENGNFELKVFNLIGKEIHRETIIGKAGANVIRLDAAEFVPGIYIYSLNNGKTTLTRRMIVHNKQ